MNKLLILLSSAILVQVSSAISIGDTLNQNIAMQTNTPTSVTQLIKSDDNSLTFQKASPHSKVKYLVNKKTNKVYSISWHTKQTMNAKDILGDKYYLEFQNASVKKLVRFRGISVGDGDLSFSQFGSMMGMRGSASVHSLSPHE